MVCQGIREEQESAVSPSSWRRGTQTPLPSSPVLSFPPSHFGTALDQPAVDYTSASRTHRRKETGTGEARSRWCGQTRAEPAVCSGGVGRRRIHGRRLDRPTQRQRPNRASCQLHVGRTSTRLDDTHTVSRGRRSERAWADGGPTEDEPGGREGASEDGRLGARLGQPQNARPSRSARINTTLTPEKATSQTRTRSVRSKAWSARSTSTSEVREVGQGRGDGL
jgi:hypothetical protein